MPQRFGERRRPLTPAELGNIPWLAHLHDDMQQRAIRELRVRRFAAGEFVCRVGQPMTCWLGVLTGLLKMSTITEQGQTTTFTGLATGSWFGEGTALKREPYRYDVQALRLSLVVELPIEVFHWLLDNSISFNRFIMRQLNERLAQFIGIVGADRTSKPDQRVAHSLASLTNPILSPNRNEVLRITQQELAYLVGLSRQRVNKALQMLAANGLIHVEYGGVRIIDSARLQAFSLDSTHRAPRR